MRSQRKSIGAIVLFAAAILLSIERSFGTDATGSTESVPQMAPGLAIGADQASSERDAETTATSPSASQPPGASGDSETSSDAQAAATSGGEDTAESEQPTDPDEIHLRQRVSQRWDALIRGDYDALYEFTSPTYRKVFSKQHFLGGYASQIKRTGIDILSVHFTNDEKTNAFVKLYILYVTELWGGQMYEGRRYKKEPWVKENGEWWIVEQR